MAKIAEGELVKVELEIRVPISATEEEVEAWLRFELHDNGSIASGNPLLGNSVETWGAFGFDWTPTGYVGIREEYDRVDLPNGGWRCKVKHRRERVQTA